MKIGYARVSTVEQDTKVQIKALEDFGCEKIFHETMSGGRWDRPELQNMLNHIRKNDTVIVWKLDRLSRSLKDLIITLEKIHNVGATFKSLTESIDTTTAHGRMSMQMIGVFAEFEREMLRERTKHGLNYARSQGRIGGRKPKLNPEQQKEAIHLIKTGQKNQAEIARLFNVNPATVSRLVGKV